MHVIFPIVLIAVIPVIVKTACNHIERMKELEIEEIEANTEYLKVAELAEALDKLPKTEEK